MQANKRQNKDFALKTFMEQSIHSSSCYCRVSLVILILMWFYKSRAFTLLIIAAQTFLVRDRILFAFDPVHPHIP